MATDREADALCTLWQSDGAAGFRLTPERLQRLAEKLQRNTRYASLATYGLCLVGIGGFAWFALTFHNPLRRAGALLTAIGIAYSLLQVHRYFLDMRSLAHGMS